MRIYWYWPFARPEDLVLADSIPGPADTIVVHSVESRLTGVERGEHRCEIVETLHAVREHREHSGAWLASRAATYVGRAADRRRYVERNAFDVCHVVYLNYFTDWWSLRHLRRRIPLVCTVHDVVPHQARAPRSLERAMLARQYREAGTIVVHHGTVRDRLLAEFDVEPSRVELVPHWVIPSVTEKRRRPGSPATVLFFGTLRRNKGVDVLLDAIGETRDMPDVRFVIAGAGVPEIEEAVRVAATRDPRLHAEIGYASPARKYDLYEAADLVVLPYTAFASQSGVLHDAYSHHVPVVVSDVGALGDTVRADGTGWVVPGGDAVALAGAIAPALGNPGALQHRSAMAAAVAEARHPRVIGAALREVYRRAIEGHAG